MKHKYIGGIILAIAVISGLLSDGTATKEAKTPEITLETKTPEITLETKTPEPQLVSADIIVSAYRNNEVSADTIYKNKKYRISGNVYSVSIVLGTPEVSIVANEGWDNIVCNFKNKEDISNINKDQDIVIEGVIKGYPAYVVSVDNCKVIK
jgi:hypothetical protein